MDQDEICENPQNEQEIPCNDSNSVEKRLPTVVADKTPPPKKKKKKSGDKSVSPPQQSNTKKRKIPRDANAPKYPKTGYVRFTNERRKVLNDEFPESDVLEITRKLAEEWNTMSEEIKRPYLLAAEEDKSRYKKETAEYNEKLKLASANSDASPPKKPKKKSKQNTEAAITDTKPSELVRDPEPERNSESSMRMHNGTANAGAVARSKIMKPCSIITPPPSPPYADQMLPMNGEIPIFTDQFLEHNRRIDAELKRLRKLNSDYEHQNSVLEKHVENMRNGIGKLTNETNDLVEENKRLQRYLDVVRQKLAMALCDLAIPTEPNGATLENIDKYMNDLVEMAKTNSHGPASLNKAKDILRKIDFNIGENVPKY